MASNHKMLILKLLEVFLVINSLSKLIDDAAAEDTSPLEAALEPYDCPFPCLPPPTATTPGSGCPPPPATSAPPYEWLYSPPAYGWQYQPPAGYYSAPPPPDPILPYFPFYYKNPPPPFGLSEAGGKSPLTACCILFVAQIFIGLL